eukprot:12763099-Alexandrium_andersonii.AAC.1
MSASLVGSEMCIRDSFCSCFSVGARSNCPLVMCCLTAATQENQSAEHGKLAQRASDSICAGLPRGSCTASAEFGSGRT